MKTRAILTIKGNVQKVGFRSSIVEQMKSLKLNGRAENLPDGTLEVICEGEKDKIEEMINKVKETPPHFAMVDSVNPKWQEYTGDLKEPQRIGDDVPVEGTQEKMLKVMQSFDRKAETVVVTLGSMDKRLESMDKRLDSIDRKQDQMLDKQDQMLGKQDQMLGKQDQTIESINQGFAKTDGNFNRMDTKYDKVSDKMDSIDNTLKELTKAILKLAGEKPTPDRKKSSGTKNSM